jgi:hypothetical protein
MVEDRRPCQVEFINLICTVESLSTNFSTVIVVDEHRGYGK